MIVYTVHVRKNEVCRWGQLRMKREMLYGMKNFITTQDVGADNVLNIL